MQPVGSIGEQVAMFVHATALDRRIRPKRRDRFIQSGAAVDDDEFGSWQAARDEVVEESPP